jgi:heme/copper-type cytochrome/quinol oxidase subunit 3
LPAKYALEKLTLLKSVHMELCELVSRTSDFFQKVFAVVQMAIFLDALFSAYYVCIALYNLESTFAGKMLHVALINTIWILITSTNLYFAVFACEKTKSKARDKNNLGLNHKYN